MSKDTTIADSTDHIALIEELCRAMRSAGGHSRPDSSVGSVGSVNAGLRAENEALIKRNQALEAERKELLATIAFLHSCIPVVVAMPTSEAIVSGSGGADVSSDSHVIAREPSTPLTSVLSGRRFLDPRTSDISGASLPMTEPSVETLLTLVSSRSSVVESTQETLVFGEGSITPTNFLLIVHKTMHGCAPPRAVLAKQKLIDAYLDNIRAAYPGVRIDKKKIIGIRAR